MDSPRLADLRSTIQVNIAVRILSYQHKSYLHHPHIETLGNHFGRYTHMNQ